MLKGFFLKNLIVLFVIIAQKLRKLWEVDLLIEENMKLTPLEIKLAATINENHLRNFQKLRLAIDEISEDNYLVCNSPEYHKRQATHIVPWSTL